MSFKTVCSLWIIPIVTALLSLAAARAAVPQVQREALSALYDSTGGDHWISNANWLKSPGVFNDPGTECSWFGVTCDVDETTVAGLQLPVNGLSGPIPPELASLTNLLELDLELNQLTGAIPSELGNLSELQALQLGSSELEGAIPPELGSLANLQILDLGNTRLSGSIPPELGNLAKLRVLSLYRCRLAGAIPAELGMLGNLEHLNLLQNELTGSIPPELGNLANLQILSLGSNQLTGSIPPELGLLTNLSHIFAGTNQLSGAIPPELGNLADLRSLDLSENQLSGSIPPELGDAAGLAHIFLNANQLTGSIPREFGKLSNLSNLGLQTNRLSGSIPPELGQLTSLFLLSLEGNQLTGSIPPELGTLASLRSLELQLNQLSGPIPPELGNLTDLVILDLHANQLTGSIPSELGRMAKLQELCLDRNLLTGSIPSELATLAALLALRLHANQLTGAIPRELGDLSGLLALTLESNQLTGPIPPELGKLTQLRFLFLDNNQLSGSIPADLGQLTRLNPGGLNLRSNHLFTDSNALREFLNSLHSGGDWESFQTLRRYFAQFGDGGGIFSKVVLFSLNDVSEATGQIEILGASGESLNVDLNGEDGIGPRGLSVPAGGLLSLQSDGLGEVQQGSVRITTDRHVEGVVIYGGGFGLAGVGSGLDSPFGFVAPMQTNESLGINTGIAVTVLGNEEAILELTLLGGDGNAIDRATDLLAARGHAALFVTDLEWDAPVDFSDLSGTLVVTAKRPVTATVIQTRPGELVTLPVAPLQAPRQEFSVLGSPAPAQSRLHFAQFADGAGAVSSQILLVNLSDQERASVQVTLRDDLGEPLTVDLGGEEVTGETILEIGPGALTVLATDGEGELQEGSVVVTSDQPLAGVIIFAGPSVGAAGVGHSPELAEGFVAPMETDSGRGVNTGVALMNLEMHAIILEAELRSSEGHLLAIAQLSLAGGGHDALFVTEFQWDIPFDFSQFEGLLRVRAGGRTAATVIQTSPGQFATIPVAPKPAT